MPSSKGRRARRRQAQPESSCQTSEELYVYSRLPDKHSIRVLELLSSADGEIECLLQTVNLADEPTFDALSYCWSNPVTIRESPIPHDREERIEAIQSLLSLHSIPTATHPNTVNIDPGAASFLGVHNALPFIDREHGRDRCKRIVCDGKTLEVTETLFSALLQLRRIIMSKSEAEIKGSVYLETLPVSRSKHLWIDQICINQEDLDERSGQIPLMNKIFASAQYVFAWIGDLDTLGSAGFREILARGCCSTHQDQQNTRMSLESMGNARKELYALAALFSRQWFRRAWVCQEAIFARRLYFWSGPLFMDWWIMLTALETIDDVDISKMAKFMGSLVRREPTAQLSKKLARMQNKTDEHEQFTATVTDEELWNQVNGAISFMKGVVQVKKHLGLQCFDTSIVVKPQRLGQGIDEEFSSLVTGFAFVPPDETLANGLYLWDRVTKETEHQDSTTLISHTWDQLSEPFAQEPRDPNQGLFRVNASFHNHNLQPLKTSAPVSISLFSLITRFRDVGASDPRDKIFAFLHLATETPGLTPNYRARVQTVFKGAARLLLDQHNLTVLSHVQDLADTKVPDLPSYVPDFSVPLGHTPFVAQDGSSPYSAGGKLGAQPNFQFTAIDDKNNITLNVMLTFGYFVDTITDVAETKGCYFTRTASLALKTPKIYAKTPGMNYVHKSHIILRLATEPGTPRAEALWRTLTGDYNSDTYPAPVATGFGFSDWVSVHTHHAIHLDSMITDHFAAAAPTPAMQTLQANQKRKTDMYIKLHADDPGGYLCPDCAQAMWDDKLVSFDPSYAKLLDDMNFVPQWNPVRYMPDSQRIKALAKCARTAPPHHRQPDAGDASSCPILSVAEHGRMAAFEKRMREVKTGRRMFCTKGNLLGMGPKSVREGDEVWVVMGAKVPFVLRPASGLPPRTYRLVGEAFVLGYMNGEVLEEKRKLQGLGLV
ncbi:hypothetical protein CC86DRAFT_399895 [Ophiobolus disseminans]|uniref:Heterokaryon incompatibility domain-containing protein n=1 Tax=Ophiobolus disseminans TaxID=1469910 RepID=A0A6A7AJF8_9PLEO|nr:hypothetical protein CC86DRAFT_399895 [Ophiobolus disseminans]